MKPVLLLTLALLALAPAARAAESCDGDCLKGLAESYMDALVARTPEKLPWAPAVAYSENRVPMQVGDGTWGTVTARSKTALEVAEPANGQVAWIGTSNWAGGYLDKSRNLELVVRDETFALRVRELHRQTWDSPYAAPIDVMRTYPRPVKAK